MTERTVFASYTDSHPTPRAWAAGVVGSALLYLALAVTVLVLGSITREVVREREIPLTFIESIARPAPPPPPPAPVAAPIVEARPAPAAAPVVPPKMKVRQLDKPPPRRELVAPKEMPREVPREAEPSEDQGIAVYGQPGPGDAAGLEGGSPTGVAGGEVGVVELPEGAQPPIPLATNRQPLYPRQAKRAGKTGFVKVRISVMADGSVGDVVVKSGEEPFVSAAVEAVRAWRYQPARFNGAAIAVCREFRIKFTLDN